MGFLPIFGGVDFDSTLPKKVVVPAGPADFTIFVDAMQGEDGLGRVEANALNLGHGRLRCWFVTTQFWHAMPWGRPPQQL
jgi:hypothetical protein